MKMQKRSLQKLAISNSRLTGMVDTCAHLVRAQLGASLPDEYMTLEKNTVEWYAL